MRINILEAGIVTFLMAGKGFLPKEEPEPQRSADMESWNSVVLPPLPKVPRKDGAHYFSCPHGRMIVTPRANPCGRIGAFL
jgi:hypothetical protein